MGKFLVTGLSVAALCCWAGGAQAAPAKSYSVKQGGESVSIQLSQDAGGWHMAITRAGACDVKVTGPATMSGGSIHMVKDDQGRPCDVELIPKPAFAEFIENSCPLHGDACRLDDLAILQPK
jgi:hypothetical protein